jgi:hypothetical protein
LATVLAGNCCLAATISDDAFVYSLFFRPDDRLDTVGVRPTNAAIEKYPDLLASGAGVELWYRYNDALQVAGLVGNPLSADAGIDAYLVQPGDAFSHNTIAKFPVIISGSKWGHQLLVGDEFWVGLSPLVPGLARKHFGWAHLKKVGPALTLVDQTFALNSDGIIVGTRNVVPESTSLALLGVLLCQWPFSRCAICSVRP